MNNSFDREAALFILASVAASYTRRELDRRVYDRIMASRPGRRLKSLTLEQKYAFEFLAYAASAIALTQTSNPGPIGQYLRDVLSDVPSELARRMINGGNVHKFGVEDLKDMVDDFTDQELELIAYDYTLRGSTSGESGTYAQARGTTSPPHGDPFSESVRAATRGLQSYRERRRKGS